MTTIICQSLEGIGGFELDLAIALEELNHYCVVSRVKHLDYGWGLPMFEVDDTVGVDMHVPSVDVGGVDDGCFNCVVISSRGYLAQTEQKVPLHRSHLYTYYLLVASSV